MRERVLAAAAVLALALAAGCAAGGGAGGEMAAGGDTAGTPPSDADPATPEPTGTEPPDPGAEPEATGTGAAGDLVIVSTVAPVADVVARVLGERGQVETLVPAGADSHTYEPRPQDVATLEDADAFLGVGLGLNDGSVRLAEANLPAGAPLVLLGEEALGPDDLVLGHTHTHDDDGHTHTHDDDGHTHTHDDAGFEDAGSSAGGANPHVWTSVRNVMLIVDRAAEALAGLDPEGADTYRANAEAYLLELRALDEALATAVDSVPGDRRKLVAYHDAWAYFGRDYRMEVVAAVQPSDFSEPSAADVRAIIDQIRDEDVPAVFGSEEFPSGVLAAIADETGATYVGDLADDTLPGAPGDAEHSYVGMMLAAGTKIVEALGGDPSPLRGAASGG